MIREDRPADSNINGVDSVTDEGGSMSTALVQVKRLGELWVCSKSYNVVICAAHFVSVSNFDTAMHACRAPQSRSNENLALRLQPHYQATR